MGVVPHRPDASANGQVLTFLVAGVLFLAAVGAMLLASRGAGGLDRGAGEAAQQQQAERLADFLVGSPGIGWASGPESIARLGLRATNGSGLQSSSLDALRGASLAAAANGKVDYAEARDSLGLGGTQDFHIRIYPVGMSTVYPALVSHARTAFIGDWVSLASMSLPAGSNTAAAQAKVNTTMFGSTANERLALRDLGLQFNDRVFISTLAPTILVDFPTPLPDVPLLTVLNIPLIEGDVYPDVKDYLNANLPDRLPRYDLLIVGSGVDQSSMTSAEFKYAVRDWVLGGGTLIVLGSSNLNYQWLQPLFSAGVQTANGAAIAPDPLHPILREPHVLDWTRYDAHGMAWDIKTQDATGFSDVLLLGDADILAVSNDGAFGQGRVILTTYLPREIAATLGQLEAENFLHNLILYTDHTKLYLEYGPTQPDNTAVAVATRQSYLYDSVLGQVPVRVEIHYWGNG